MGGLEVTQDEEQEEFEEVAADADDIEKEEEEEFDAALDDGAVGLEEDPAG